MNGKAQRELKDGAFFEESYHALSHLIYFSITMGIPPQRHPSRMLSLQPLWQLFNPGQEFSSLHIWPEYLWDHQALKRKERQTKISDMSEICDKIRAHLSRLIVLHNTAQSSLRRT